MLRSTASEAPIWLAVAGIDPLAPDEWRLGEKIAALVALLTVAIGGWLKRRADRKQRSELHAGGRSAVYEQLREAIEAVNQGQANRETRGMWVREWSRMRGLPDSPAKQLYSQLGRRLDDAAAKVAKGEITMTALEDAAVKDRD
jgi:hypothetical protein